MSRVPAASPAGDSCPAERRFQSERLPKRLHINRVRQPCGVAGFEGWDGFAVQPALSFHRFFHVPKARFAQHFIEIAEVKGRPVLPIAEDEIGEAPPRESKWRGKSS